jgi:hypothetical protein
MESSLPSTNSSLFNIPKLAEDGSNWISYMERTLTAIGARGLMWHINGSAIKPIPFDVDPTTKVITKKDGSTALQTEIDEHDKIDEYYQKNSLVTQQIFSTITDRLLLHVQKLKDVSEIWKEICQIHEGKMELVQIDLRWCLQEMRCDEGGDVKAHFAELLWLRESLAGMGSVLVDTDFPPLYSAHCQNHITPHYHPLALLWRLRKAH